MKRMRTHGRTKLVALLLASGCIAAWAAGQWRSAQDGTMVTNMLDQKHTVCAGRFRVDVPVAAKFSFHEAAAFALWDGITSSIRRPKMNLVPSVRRLKPGTFSSLHCLQSDNTPCGSDELMSDARWSDDGTTLKQSVGTSASNSIVKPVSTLP